MLKKIIIIGIMLLLILTSVNFAFAEFWACFSKGEVVDRCSPNAQDKTCGSTLCKYCMRSYEDPPGCYNSGNPDKCNGLPPDQQGCNAIGGNATMDSEPPELTLISPSPLNDSVFTSTAVKLVYTLDERADVYIFDERRERWTRICNSCNGRVEQPRRFDEGFNELFLKAVDVVGNEAFASASFFIDSKKPRITKTEPKGGFASGNFNVEFREENPESLVLTYGNSFRNQNVDLGACSDIGGGKKSCDVSVDLSDFDASDILYWFNITDIAGNSDASKPITVSVDVSDPVINALNYSISGKFVTFTLDITEQNLDEVSYIDVNDPRARWARLCTSLDSNICQKRVSFNDGQHNVTINVTDEAGNYASQQISFFTDSKNPKITGIEPVRGFADGNFHAEFIEENPQELIISYGNSATGFRNSALDIENDCYEERSKHFCDTNIDLQDYHAQKIEYWFNLTDIIGNADESRHVNLDVDTVFPIINDLNYTVDGRRVNFVINITEENFDSVEYMDNEDSRPMFRMLCSRLSSNICERTLSFRTGFHDLSIQVNDEAGNAVGEGVSFNIT